jgi:hypothetical protein
MLLKNALHGKEFTIQRDYLASAGKSSWEISPMKNNFFHR